jgi:hypothetical protein
MWFAAADRLPRQCKIEVIEPNEAEGGPRNRQDQRAALPIENRLLTADRTWRSA